MTQLWCHCLLTTYSVKLLMSVYLSIICQFAYWNVTRMFYWHLRHHWWSCSSGMAVYVLTVPCESGWDLNLFLKLFLSQPVEALPFLVAVCFFLVFVFIGVLFLIYSSPFFRVTRKHWYPLHGPPLRTGSVDYLRTGPRTTPMDPSTDHPPNIK